MKLKEYNFNDDNGFNVDLDPVMNSDQTLVLGFSNAPLKSVSKVIDSIKQDLPDAILLGCSTSGQIHNSQLSDQSVLVTVMHLE